MSRIKFEDFFIIFQDRVNQSLNSQKLSKYKYTDGISCLRMSHNDSSIFMGALDGSILVFDLKTEQTSTLYKMSGKDAEITALVISIDDRYVGFGSSNSSIGVYDLVAKDIKYIINNMHQGIVSFMRIYYFKQML